MDLLVGLIIVAGAWLLVVCVLYRSVVQLIVQPSSGLGRLAICSLAAAALLGPGVVGSHAILPVPSGLALALAITDGSIEMILFNGLCFVVTAILLLQVNSRLRQRARHQP